MSLDEIMKLLPQQWLGLCTLILFIIFVLGQLIEKSEQLAKLIPFGKWWHERQRRARNRRADWLTEDNIVISALREQIASLGRQLGDVQQTQRAFAAWTIYDARWHHRTGVLTAQAGPECTLPPHMDFFEFERLWREDPIAAAALPF